VPRNQSRNTKGISSVNRALSILELFDHHTDELGVTEMARHLNLHKSTLSGLVHTLLDRGYLDRNPVTRKYHLGIKLIERAFVALSHLDISRIALPYMESLREWRDETVNLAILDGDEVVYIERLLSSHTLGMHSRIGKRAMAYSTALGKALLSQLPESELEAFLANFNPVPVTPNTITDLQKFRDELELVRRQGYAVDMEENEVGGVCIGAPIIDHRFKAIAAISIAIPKARISPRDLPELGAKVMETAQAISRGLGYMPENR